MTDTRPDVINEYLRLFGVVHPSLGRRLRPGKQADHVQPISHAEQERRLANVDYWKPHRALEPAKIAVEGARGYNSKLHLPDPHIHPYTNIMTNADRTREIGRAYERLPHHDPAADKHFAKMRDEILAQHHHMTHVMGIRSEPVDYDPYPTAKDMINDVQRNHRIKVLSSESTGGHSFLTDDENNKFRAVHDLFGHAATGRSFDAHGEDAAWAAHSRMFSPQARAAMSSETRGQNAALHLNGEFQDQKTAILPRHMWDDQALRNTAARAHLINYAAFVQRSAVKHITEPGESRALCGQDVSSKLPYTDAQSERANCPECFSLMEEDHPYSAVSDTHSPSLAQILSTGSLRKQAHDSGDGVTIFHCPFCGSGQVIGRSDGTTECQYCGTAFVVKVQPVYPSFPQTIDGQPVQVPGMPPRDPAMGADQPVTDDPQNPQGEDGPPVDPQSGGVEEEADSDNDDDSQDEGEGGPPAFLKGSSLRLVSTGTLD